MRTGRYAAVCAASIGLSIGFVAAPAAASTAAPRTIGVQALVGMTRLELTVADGERATPVRRKVSLRCQPAGGTHPAARRACAALASAGGDPAALPTGNGMCAMVYQPVTVTARGLWRGRVLRYQQTFGNECELTQYTGVVFRF